MDGSAVRQAVRQAVGQAIGAVVLAVLCGVQLAAQSAKPPAIDPYTVPVVQAACGPEGGSPPPIATRSSGADSPLEPGKARIYVITESRSWFGSKGKPILLGIDGAWFASSADHSYRFSDVAPGIHHLCAASDAGGVLPHTRSAVALARIETAAGGIYYFSSLSISLLGTLELQRVNSDEGAMYLQSFSSSQVPAPKSPIALWETAAAQRACGSNPAQSPGGDVPPPTLPGPPAPGMALVYFFDGLPRFGSHGPHVLVGMDGQWVAKTQLHSYVAVQIAPGQHHLCSTSAAPLGGGKPTLALGGLDAVAGRTYFVNTRSLEAQSDSLAVVWLRRIAAMPRSDKPNMDALKQWNRTNFPYSQDELRACGIPATDSAVAGSPIPPSVRGTPSSAPEAFFLLKSDFKLLHRRNAVNVGMDGRWAASLRTTSWAAVPLTPGQHRVCIHVDFGRMAPDVRSLYLDSIHAGNGRKVYFGSTIGKDDDGPDIIMGPRLDPDEGAMLVALYPAARAIQP